MVLGSFLCYGFYYYGRCSFLVQQISHYKSVDEGEKLICIVTYTKIKQFWHQNPQYEIGIWRLEITFCQAIKGRYHLNKSLIVSPTVWTNIFQFLSMPWILFFVEVTCYTNDLTKKLVLAIACIINSYGVYWIVIFISINYSRMWSVTRSLNLATF